MMRLVQRWWNGHWGRLARHDLWLYEMPDGTWQVHARQGDSDGRMAEWPFPDLASAEAALALLRETATPPGRWRDLAPPP